MLAKKFVLGKTINGIPEVSDFLLVEETLPELKDGEICVKAEWLSVDPFIRIALSSMEIRQVIPGAQVGKVISSKCAEFPVGAQVIGRFGWRDLTIYKPEPNGPRAWNTIERLTDFKGLPHSYALGVLGMPGNTAYFGVVEVLNPQPGETLLVSTASGSIGSLVGQIGKIRGCKVIGLTGSDEKMEWLKNDLGFDLVFNYKKFESIEEALKTHVPEGIDCYFDNLGGDFTSRVMQCMNNLGRVAQCGSMSSYNNQKPQDLEVFFDPLNMRMKNLSVLGFNTGRWAGRWSEGINQLRDWILQGKIKPRETVSNGFETMPQSFIAMLNGKNLGKQIIKA